MILKRCSVAIVGCLGMMCPVAFSGMAWFDEIGGGTGYSDFKSLTAAHSAFMGKPEGLIDFGGLQIGEKLSDQYYESFGVTFENTASNISGHQTWGGVRQEGDCIIEDITGYDGSYMSDKDQVYGKFDNEFADSAFSIVFDKPVSSVGAFVGMGIQGSVHSLEISLFDVNNVLLDTQVVDSWLWDSVSYRQNYESFFGVQTDSAVISRVEILNNAKDNYANALIIDNISFSGGGPSGGTAVPEPTSLALISICGMLGLVRRR